MGYISAFTPVLCILQLSYLRRFCLHILPKGYIRMRHYGILASKNKAKELNIAKKDLGQAPWERLKIDWKTIAEEVLKVDVTKCSKCKVGVMEISHIIYPQRGSPVFKITRNLNFLTT